MKTKRLNKRQLEFVGKSRHWCEESMDYFRDRLTREDSVLTDIFGNDHERIWFVEEWLNMLHKVEHLVSDDGQRDQRGVEDLLESVEKEIAWWNPASSGDLLRIKQHDHKFRNLRIIRDNLMHILELKELECDSAN